MRKLTTTLAAACCFALLSAQAQADEVVVIAPMDIVSVTWPTELREASEAVEEAKIGAANAASRVAQTYVRPEEQTARSQVCALLRYVETYEGSALHYLDRAGNSLERIYDWGPYDPRVEMEIEKFKASRAAAYQWTYRAYYHAQMACNLASTIRSNGTVGYECYGVSNATGEALRETAEFLNMPVDWP